MAAENAAYQRSVVKASACAANRRAKYHPSKEEMGENHRRPSSAVLASAIGSAKNESSDVASLSVQQPQFERRAPEAGPILYSREKYGVVKTNV